MVSDAGEPAQRDFARTHFERSDLTLVQIARGSGLTVSKLRELAGNNRWRNQDRDDPHFDTRLLLTRLFEALDGEITRLEARMRKDEDASEVAALGRLANVMDKLLALDGTLSKRKTPTRESVEMIELRRRIVRRMKELDVK